MAEPTAIVPDKGIRGCLNAGGSTIGFGIGVVLAAAGERLQVTASTAGAAVYGIVAETQGIAAGTWGDVQVEGIARGVAGAAVAKGAAVAANASGQFITATAGAIVVGHAVTAAGAAAAVFEIELAGPGGGYVSP